MAIIFDPVNRRIVLDKASVTATEIFSRWEDWAAMADNAKYGMVIRQVGGDDLGGGLSIPPYYFLRGEWRVRPMEADHDLTITGNLFVDGGGTPVVRTLGPYQVNVNYTVPVQAQGISTTGSTGPTVADIATAVWGNQVEGTYTAEQILRLMSAVLAGKVSGAGTGTEVFRAVNDSTDRVTISVTSEGNRTKVIANVI
jgi:hypothetical protein